MKTGQMIEDDVYSLIKNSVSKPVVNGDVYKFGLRPRDSEEEDIVVKFITGLSNQIQTGRVLIQCYVPNMETSQNGVKVKNITRCREIEEAIMNWYKSLKGLDYYFTLASTIQTFPDEEINQHFVSVRLDFKLLTT